MLRRLISIFIFIQQPSLQRKHPSSSYPTSPAQVHLHRCLSDFAKKPASQPPTRSTRRVQVRPRSPEPLPPHPRSGGPRVQHRVAAVRMAAAPAVPSRKPHSADLHPGSGLPVRPPPSVHLGAFLLTTQVRGGSSLRIGAALSRGHSSAGASTRCKQDTLTQPKATHSRRTGDCKARRRYVGAERPLHCVAP